MAQEKIYRLSHFLPDGHPAVYPINTKEVKEVTRYITTVGSGKWIKIPNHNLELIATMEHGVPCIGFRTGGKEIFLHVFCNEYMNPINAIELVAGQYVKFNLGIPRFAPEELNWVHSIPLPGSDISYGENMFVYQLTHSMFWMIYMEYKLKRIK
jgi:hypothetical protein